MWSLGALNMPKARIFGPERIDDSNLDVISLKGLFTKKYTKLSNNIEQYFIYT